MASKSQGNELIAAIATPPGRGGIGIVRLSGPGLADVAHALMGGLPVPRLAALRRFLDAAGEPIDAGIALYFPCPASYTGEDVLELQVHGSPVVLKSLLHRCVELGARIAHPGEFTLRAFLNGRMDLTQAEAVADLIDAGSERAARSALRALAGELGKRIRALAEQVRTTRALIEACLDFPEEDIDRSLLDRIAALIDTLAGEVGQLLESGRRGQALRAGWVVVLAGAPNAGKSSLMNRMTGSERAIVSELPGTTRDTLREPIAIAGIPVLLVDTAGLHVSTDPIEQLGMARTREEIGRADLVITVIDASACDPTRRSAAIDPLIVPLLPRGVRRIVVWNKIDLTGERPGDVSGAAPATYAVSARTGAGIDELSTAIAAMAGLDEGGEDVVLARARHLGALTLAAEALAHARARTGQLELLAEELRSTQSALAEMTGEVGADDLLGDIFSRFCIGK